MLLNGSLREPFRSSIRDVEKDFYRALALAKKAVKFYQRETSNQYTHLRLKKEETNSDQWYENVYFSRMKYLLF